MCSREEPCDVLLLEDDHDQVILFKSIIALDGRGIFRVTSVDSVGRALFELSKKSYNLVLMDLNVKDSKGIDTFLRFKPYFNKVPMIVLTSFSSEILADQTQALGASDYVVKGDYLGRAIVNIMTRTISRHKNIEELMAICHNLRQQLAVLKGESRTDVPEAFKELESIADSLEEKAQLMRAGG
jgi:DNA-binding NtrC family response regulator